MGYYVHHVPGRLRVRIPQLKQYPRRIEKVRKAFACIGGIDCIEHKRTTGSVVVHYDPELMDDSRILNILSYNGLFDEALRVSSVEESRKTGERAGDAVGRIAFSWALGRVLDANGLSFLSALV